MRIGFPLSYGSSYAPGSGAPGGGWAGQVARLRDFQHAGVSSIHVAEAYSFDAVSQLGYLAAALPGMQLAADILPIYTRTPTLLAMTAAGLDMISDGRFTLGLGASGPQVIEGFHGVPYDAPLARTAQIIDICRQVWRRERVEAHTSHYDIPLSMERGGSGLGKSLKLINTPLRSDIPILIASMGPKNVELTARLAQQWAPFFFRPEGADEVWGEALRAGNAQRDPALGELEIIAPVALAIGDDVDHLIDGMRPQLALYLGGMGARGSNFYRDLAARYGYGSAADTIAELYLTGHRTEAEAAVPIDLIRSISLVGPRAYVAERVAAFTEAGVGTLAVRPLAPDPARQLEHVSTLADLVL